MSARTRLPNRRQGVAETLTWAKKDWLLSCSFDAEGKVREVFLDGVKVGSDQEALVDDACILFSLLLQHGQTVQEIAHSLSREGPDPGELHEGEPPAASLLGMLAQRLARAEASCGTIMRQVHQLAPRRAAEVAKDG